PDDGGTFLVQQEAGDRGWQPDNDGACLPLHRFFFHQAQYRQAKGLDIADTAFTIAPWTGDMAVLTQGRAQALAREFQQSEAGNASHLHARTLLFRRFTDLVLDLSLVAIGPHVDEVNDDQPPQVTQAQLPSNFVHGFQVGD